MKTLTSSCRIVRSASDRDRSAEKMIERAPGTSSRLIGTVTSNPASTSLLTDEAGNMVLSGALRTIAIASASDPTSMIGARKMTLALAARAKF